MDKFSIMAVAETFIGVVLAVIVGMLVVYFIENKFLIS